MIHPPKQGESQIGTQGNPLRFRFLAGRFKEPKLSDGDLILVDRAQRQIAYALRIDTDLLVKNVQRVRPGVIALFSANALYPPREIDAEGLGGVVGIIGRVVASMQEW